MKTFYQFSNESFLSKENLEKLKYFSSKMKHPVVIHKGVDGKIGLDGQKINIHNIPGVIFGSYDFKKAKKYDRGNGVDTYIIDTDKIERVKAPSNLSGKEFRKKEIELIQKSKADIVELDTIDANGREIQVVVKVPDKLIKIGNTKND